MQHIHCTVSNCYYWDSGNVCLAKEIMVTVDSVGEEYPDEFDATNMMEVAKEVGSMPADSCMATCCKTFNAKGKGTPPVPKITRAEYDKSKSAKM